MFLVRSFPFVAASAALCGAFVAPAHAQTVYDNGSANNTYGYYSDNNLSQYIADTFTFNAPTTFNNIVWFGGYYPNNTAGVDNFTITLHNTTGGVPDATPLTTFTVGNTATRTNTGGTFTTFGSQSVFQYSATLGSNVNLGPGTYGISIVNNTTSANNYWLWAGASTTGDAFVRSNPNGNFSTAGGEMAFRLVNNVNVAAVPEPGEWATIGIATAGLGGLMIRAKRRNGKGNAAVTA